MTPQQRQRLVNAGFSRKGLTHVDAILDRTPTAQHDAVIRSLTAPRAPVTSNVRRVKAHLDDDLSDEQVADVLVEMLPKAITEELRSQICRITGRLD